MSAALGAAHRFLSRRPVVVALAIKLRNQCNCVIHRRLEDTADATVNGEMSLIEKLAPHCRTFVDVGANVGRWSAAFAASMPPGGRGLLFEPSLSAQQALRERFYRDERIEIVPMAVSDTSGTAIFFEEPDSGETSSLVPHQSRVGAQPRTVSTTTLDRETSERGWEKIDFLKIDAEGYDFRVLQGARQLLSSQNIGGLQFEYNASWALAGSTLARALGDLHDFGYQTFLLKSEGLYRFGHREYEKYRDFFGYANFVAFSPPLLSLMASSVGALSP